MLIDTHAHVIADDRARYPNYSASHELAYAQYAELARFACSQLGPGEREFFQAGTALRFWPELGE